MDTSCRWSRREVRLVRNAKLVSYTFIFVCLYIIYDDNLRICNDIKERSRAVSFFMTKRSCVGWVVVTCRQQSQLTLVYHDDYWYASPNSTLLSLNRRPRLFKTTPYEIDFVWRERTSMDFFEDSNLVSLL